MPYIVCVISMTLLTSCNYITNFDGVGSASIYLLNTVPPDNLICHEVFLDDELLVCLQGQQYTWVRVQPRKYTLRIEGAPGVGRRQSLEDIEIKSGTTQYFAYDLQTADGYLVDYSRKYARNWMRVAQYVKASTE